MLQLIAGGRTDEPELFRSVEIQRGDGWCLGRVEKKEDKFGDYVGWSHIQYCDGDRGLHKSADAIRQAYGNKKYGTHWREVSDPVKCRKGQLIDCWITIEDVSTLGRLVHRRGLVTRVEEFKSDSLWAWVQWSTGACDFKNRNGQYNINLIDVNIVNRRRARGSRVSPGGQGTPRVGSPTTPTRNSALPRHELVSPSPTAAIQSSVSPSALEAISVKTSRAGADNHCKPPARTPASTPARTPGSGKVASVKKSGAGSLSEPKSTVVSQLTTPAMNQGSKLSSKQTPKKQQETRLLDTLSTEVCGDTRRLQDREPRKLEVISSPSWPAATMQSEMPHL